MTLVTFIIPVRHQANSNDWPSLKRRLSQTIASISGQTNGDWRAVIVANEGADLPDLPPKFSAERVTFPPNQLHDINGADREKVYDAFRLDKGRRVLAGMLSARDTRFFMIVDDDDFVSANIVEFAARNADANGWKIDRGYLWNEGGRLLLHHNDFANFCGTSLIIRSDLYRLPATFEDADIDYIKSMLGSHVRIGKMLADQGHPLGSLPFRGAIYLQQNHAHTLAHCELLQPRLLPFRAAGFGFAQVEDGVLSFKALHRCIQDFLFAMGIFLEDRVALSFTNLLKDHLLRQLRGDAAQGRSVLVHADLAANFHSGSKLVCFFQGDLVDGIFKLVIVGHNGLVDIGSNLARVLVQFSAHVLLGLVVLAGGKSNRLFHGANHDLGLNALFAAQEFDTLI